ncbi:fungal specific transcription factor domain-containing protein [Purpureocillium lavendulum]|uniref:Fungal specific transcription factor domain-containing protein n=1 Tax=Purpureocillium lavendulum TaxID=1247861 RepID=A0AB34FI50_9HYPO|nr:fungal specific transcription factor domain-containing protein [Purpureocillium lavendulum]
MPLTREPASPDRVLGGDHEAESEPTGRLQPTSRMTGHQWFYVFVLDGLGGMALSGAVNFGIAYAMYTTQDTTKRPIRLFGLPNTLAGDAAVTIIVQCIITWFVEMALVAHDLAHRSVHPVGWVPVPKSRRRWWLRWWFFLPASSSGSSSMSEEEPDAEAPVERVRANSVNAVFQQAVRGFSLAVPSFLLLWPISVGVLTAVGRKEGNDYVFADKWAPQVFKLILGGVLGLLTTPLMALFWLVRAGWEAGSPAGPS